MASPFLDIPKSRWVAENDLAFAIRDGFPVSPGHTLVIPKREVATWFEASNVEQHGILELVDLVKRQLDKELEPDGYNVGFNSGSAAGQTVFHLHVHVIPRFNGDVADPRGGVRHVIPGKGNYLVAQPQVHGDQTLLTGGDDRMLRALLDGLRAYERIDMVVSFILLSGLELLESGLEDALGTGAVVRVLTTDYLHVTESTALAWLFDRQSDSQLETRIYTGGTLSFHPKSYVFYDACGTNGCGFVGSSNVSRSGLAGGIEWNLQATSWAPLRAAFDELWVDDRTLPLTEAWLSKYRLIAAGAHRKLSSSHQRSHWHPPNLGMCSYGPWTGCA